MIVSSNIERVLLLGCDVSKLDEMKNTITNGQCQYMKYENPHINSITVNIMQCIYNTNTFRALYLECFMTLRIVKWNVYSL